jgi:ABC-type branched-subunit amino acid transport system ATPase component
MITVESLTRRYAGFIAVDNVSFAVKPGRVTGFPGPNGAGKSITMRVMVGLTARSAVLENDWRGHVPQISVSVLFWVAVPLAAGVVRTIRRDVG